uniref:NADH-ubiquinone oxidoreductase chain 2 n=1 Tax=Erotylidae sp. BMNH 1274392 TaxID=1796504 RepID=A0A140EFW6_9CUCU|nr:NADH dehydrogenase subunit 2 [Erotylidae sp. BMNH 1274392]
MIKFYKLLFLNTLIMSTLITISSISWFSMWLGLEINLLSIIPLFKNHKNMYPAESALKYFITQAMASTIILFSIIMSVNMNELIPQSLFMFKIMMNSGFLIKMGAAPFHFWFPEIIEGLNWTNCLLLLTWQKIAPMTVFMYNLKMSFFITCIIILSSVISGLMGLNQISLRKIMAYSSINHIGWMLASMLNLNLTWMVYFLCYSIISINIILITKMLNIFYIEQTINSFKKKSTKLFFMFNFLSLGGLPPFLGFFPKWIVANNLIDNNFFLISTIMIVLSLIPLYFYLRITFSSVMIKTVKSFNLVQTNNFFIYMTNMISLSGLIFSTAFFSLF